MLLMRIVIALILMVSLIVPAPALAISLIRDAEVESALNAYAAPIFRAANIEPSSTKIYIVNDPSINAFTVGGLSIFINTGLILRSDNANMVIGVMAHETGHIAGGHIIKKIGEMEDMGVQNILTAILGAAVSVAGLPGAGMAVMAGGQQVLQRNYMSFNRQQEVVADAAAIKFLRASHQSADGMLKMFEILRRDQTLSYGDVDPYTVSHPLSQERIAHIRSETMDQVQPTTDPFQEIHQRIVAKLYGFLEKPENTFFKYTDESVPAQYARSIAYFRQSNFEKSFAELDKLLIAHPNDPFFNELKGQFLTESGKPAAAIEYYDKANKLFPNSSLIKSELAKVLLGEGRVDEAITHLTLSAALEKTNGETWRMLATAYGKKNNEAMSNLMLAEEANVRGNNAEARKFARQAKDKLPKDSPALQRANDILADIKLQKNKKEGKEEE